MNRLWSLEDIAAFASYSKKTAYRVVSQPDFPTPVRVYNGAQPRWIDEEVTAWREARERAGKPLLIEPARNTALYRHFNADGRLLYVGVSVHTMKRIMEHRMHSGWFTQIAKIELEWFESRDDALKAEAEAIRTERPRYNVSAGKLDS